MSCSKKIVCVIPARLNSSRFPRKILCHLLGKPLLQRVWEKAQSVDLFDQVVFAIDAEETAALIDTFQGKYIFTSPSCESGTDRLIELMQNQKVEADIWVNWQADEPFINQEMVEDLLQSSHLYDADVWTLKKKILLTEEIHNPHIPKVVCDEKGNALYFSRSPIPYHRDPSLDAPTYFKHIGMYAYTKEALSKIAHSQPCELELSEKLEQLRFLHHRLSVRVHETQHEVLGIDLPEHLALAEAKLLQM
ncbi:MAG: 3-deoxy-manno-octulosonate cytidylyltransferase [Chlamydiales bacterium]|nr:3-deoxy-manno-octulosonate cytidylyltransferase [Chlamydiales bacterium]